MNMSIRSIWEDYLKNTDYIQSTDDALKHIEDAFGFSGDELTELQEVCADYIVDYFNIKKLKKKHLETYNSLVGLLMTMFFFGMQVGNDSYWHWPEKK